MYAALASQKNYMSVYLMGIYSNETARQKFESAYRAKGKRFDAGKSCVRFKKLADLPLDLVGQSIASYGMQDYIKLAKKAKSERTTPKD
jgi:hypothetical protein